MYKYIYADKKEQKPKDIKAHHNSDKPARLQTAAYTQGNHIYMRPGQESKLSHEPGHAVQQKQDIVKATRRLMGLNVNDLDVMGCGEDRAGDAAAIRKDLPLYCGRRADPVIQMRSPNPFEFHDNRSPRVHHIIPHSLIENKFNGLQAEQKLEVQRSFMPKPESLTIWQLMEITKALKVIVEERVISKDDAMYDAVSLLPFNADNLIGELSGIKLRGAGFNDTPISEFIQMYNGIRENGEIPDGTKDYWSGLLESYLMWSPGNLFYGPVERSEPGGTQTDAFDSDAQFFRGKEHVERLEECEQELRAAKADEKEKIKGILIKMSRITRDAGTGPVHDASKWLIADTLELQDAILNLLPPGPRRNYFMNHRDKNNFPKELLKSYVLLGQKPYPIMRMAKRVAENGEKLDKVREELGIPHIISMVNNKRGWWLMNQMKNERILLAFGRGGTKLEDIKNLVADSLNSLSRSLGL